MKQQSTELVSVIMCIYNEQEEWLRKSIESILNQTWKNIELIIVIDNPDNKMLKKVVAEYAEKDARIKVIQNEKNIGIARSSNKAWKTSKGCFVAKMDADDISRVDRIEHEIEFAYKKTLDLVFSNRINISEKGDELLETRALPSDEKIYKILPYGDIIVNSSVLISRKILEETGGYRDLPSAEDYDLWLRILTSKNGYKIGGLDEKLIYYRIRENSISRENIYKQYLYTNYVRKLYNKRKRGNTNDDFSQSNLKNYINKNYNDKKNIKFIKGSEYFEKSVEYVKKGERFLGISFFLKAFFSSFDFAKQTYFTLICEVIRRWK